MINVAHPLFSQMLRNASKLTDFRTDVDKSTLKTAGFTWDTAHEAHNAFNVNLCRLHATTSVLQLFQLARASRSYKPGATQQQQQIALNNTPLYCLSRSLSQPTRFPLFRKRKENGFRLCALTVSRECYAIKFRCIRCVYAVRACKKLSCLAYIWQFVIGKFVNSVQVRWKLIEKCIYIICTKEQCRE